MFELSSDDVPLFCLLCVHYNILGWGDMENSKWYHYQVSRDHLLLMIRRQIFHDVHFLPSPIKCCCYPSNERMEFFDSSSFIVRDILPLPLIIKANVCFVFLFPFFSISYLILIWFVVVRLERKKTRCGVVGTRNIVKLHGEIHLFLFVCNDHR
jgi:hypothetical protein